MLWLKIRNGLVINVDQIISVVTNDHNGNAKVILSSGFGYDLDCTIQEFFSNFYEFNASGCIFNTQGRRVGVNEL